MNKLLNIILVHKKKVAIVSLIVILASSGIFFVAHMQIQRLNNNQQEIATLMNTVSTRNDIIASLKGQIKSISNSLTQIQSTDTDKQVTSLQSQLDSINGAFASYTSLQKLIGQAKSEGVNV